MIPKIIHYCWFGGNPLPSLAIRCINSWKKFFPDYEIKEWNENNFDVNIIPYTQEAYQAKKYAFVSDYARFWILYHYGGLYFDTDVEVIRPMDDIIARGPFMGCENEVSEKSNDVLVVAPGLGLGIESNSSLYKEILDMYETQHFIDDKGSLNLKTVVTYVSELLQKYGLKNVNDIQECCGIYIYPKDWFCPMDYNSGKIYLTSHTRTIHHYSASWFSRKEKLRIRVIRLIGDGPTRLLRFIKHLFVR